MTAACCPAMQNQEMMMCDPAACATMTKEECAEMCKSHGCDAAQTAACMAMYDADGKYKGATQPTTTSKTVSTKVIMEKLDGNKVKATVTKSVDGMETSEVFEGTEAEVKAKVDALK